MCDLAETAPTFDAADRDGTDPVVAWSVHGVRDAPHGVALVVGGYAAAFWLWLRLFPEPTGLFLPAVALTSALAEYLFPIRYRIGADGVHADCGWFQRLHLPWDRIRRATRGADGYFFSPLARASRLDTFRGIRARVPSSERSRVDAIVVRYRAAPTTVDIGGDHDA